MNRIIEIIAMALGGFSLLAVSFLGFAVMTGAPLHEMAVVGSLFESPEKTDAELLEEKKRDERPATNKELLEINEASLSSWSLPSPFSVIELEGLETKLRERSNEQDMRTMKLDARETELDQQTDQIAEQLETLTSMRESLQALSSELDSRSSEVERDELMAEADADAEARKIAEMLGSFDLEARATCLLETYTDSAALILSHMPEKASKTLAQMYQVDPEVFLPISQDYARLTAGT